MSDKAKVNMTLPEQVDVLIEKIRPLMPSSGFWPVTVMRLTDKDLKGLSFGPNVLSTQQLLFLIRTDFSDRDLIDYISNTEEYISMPTDRQQDYLDYAIKKANDSSLINWSEKIASFSIGIAIQLSENMNLCIEPIDESLSELDCAFNFSGGNLKAYRLFDIYSCH